MEQRRWLKRVRNENGKRFERGELTPLGRRYSYQDAFNKALGPAAAEKLEEALSALEREAEFHRPKE